MSSESKEYRGNCHCGLFKFRINIPELTNFAKCECSFCVKNGILWRFPVSTEQLSIETGEGVLTEYEFGRKSQTHLFCPRCGSSVMSRGKGSKGNGINIRLLRDIDLEALTPTPFPGDTIGAPYEPPIFPSDSSLGEIQDNMSVYFGNCHCGAVTYAVKTKPLEEQEVMKCNCSLCSRNGDYFIYPPASSVNLQGRENLVGYAFLTEKSLHSFCKVCGTSVCVQVLHEGEDLMPLNVRTIDGVGLDDLKYKHHDGASAKPLYKG